MVSQVLIFDQPRSASHLLYRLLSRQSKLKYLEHPFSPSRGKQVEWLMGPSYRDGMKDDALAAFNDSVKAGIDRWERAFEDAQQNGTSLLLIDHAFNAASPDTIIRMIDEISRSSSNGPSGYNVTDLPESLLLRRGTVPLFTIRDPRITVPATFRVLGDMDLPHGSGRPNFTVSASPLWIRNLYNYFTSKGIEPLIVDADDFLANPDLVKELCAKLGLDAKELLWSWPKPTADERAGLHPHFYASQRALIESEGIRPELASINRDLDAEKKAWKIDFGEDASMVEEMIDLALPHYQWLKDRAFGKADVAAIK